MKRGSLSSSGHCDESVLAMKLSALGVSMTPSNPRTASSRGPLSAFGKIGCERRTPSSKNTASGGKKILLFFRLRTLRPWKGLPVICPRYGTRRRHNPRNASGFFG